MQRSSVPWALRAVCLIVVIGCSDVANDASAPIAGSAKDSSGSTGEVLSGQPDSGAASDGAGESDPGGPAPRLPDFGASCDSGEDCTSGYCVEGPTGKVCTEACTETCPNGWGCEQVFFSAGDVTFVCVPSFIRLCRPCSEHADCQVGFLENQTDLCLPFGNEGSFCGGGCADRPCPSGYECADRPIPGGDVVKQCVPADGAVCECDPAWASLGLSTNCQVANEHGTCAGSRACASSGLTACDAPAPAADVCDGQDNDCDGETDEEGGAPCEVTNQHGTCTGTETCGDGPATCSAKTPAAETCNKLDDDCDGETDESTCDDGVPCTEDVCQDDGSCSHPIASNACRIEQSCYAAGDWHPTAPCLQCQPLVSQDSWSGGEGKPCEDGNLCTTGEICTGSQCAGGSPLDCSVLTDVCNAGICDPLTGGCVQQPKAGTCDDGDPCTINDTCQDGVCLGTPMDCSHLTGPCSEGQCNGGTCQKIVLQGTCDDGDPCTSGDFCQGGACVGTLKDCSSYNDQCNLGVCQAGNCTKQPTTSPCNDNDPCTTGDVCAGGTCTGTPKDCSHLSGSCTQGVCQGGSCVQNPVSGSCSDGDPCTTGDQCLGGACLGTAKNCSGSSDQCNTGVCEGGSCVKQPKSGSCNDNDSCTTGDVCSGGQCEGTPSTDSYEPNQSSSGAYLNKISDCAGLDHQLSASIYPAGDTDWFWYEVSDDFGCDVQPKATLSMPSGVNYQLCIYFECKNGKSVEVDCHGATEVSGPKSISKGCCSTNGGSTAESVKLSPNCDGFAEDGYVDVKVYSSSGATCDGYTLKWGDD